MLKPILKSEGVNESERQLSKLLNDTFFSLWSYIGPYSDEGATKNKQGKEICDALVIFGNKILIFSDKAIKFNEEKDTLIAWKRWYKKSITDSVRQLYAAEEWIKKNPDRVFLDNFCQNPFPLNLENQNFEFHLIAITKNTLEPAKKYFDQFAKGSSGTFLNFYPLDERQVLEMPFTLCDINSNKTFVHIFDEFSINLVMQELRTISDFTNYLKVKEKLIRKLRLQHASEEDILGFFLDDEDFLLGRKEFTYPKCADDEVLGIQEGYWSNFILSNNYNIHKDLNNMGDYWVELSSRFSDSVVSANVGEGKEFPLEKHEIVVRSLASEKNATRAYLAQAFLEKFDNVPLDRRSARVVQNFINQSHFYVFLFLPFMDFESTIEHTKRRGEIAWQYAIATKYRHSKVELITVIVTQPKGSKIRNEAIYLYNYSKKLTVEEEELAKRIIHEASILKEFTDYSKPSKDYDGVLKVKWGRNDICHCGSKRKYKKCCLNKDQLLNNRYT